MELKLFNFPVVVSIKIIFRDLSPCIQVFLFDFVKCLYKGEFVGLEILEDWDFGLGLWEVKGTDLIDIKMIECEI